MTWYIDALDPRAGVAFATQRDTDLASDIPSGDGPTVFIGPPSFTPESVATRSVGFAMARYQGQLGLFGDDDKELPFNSLAAIAEFVRRVYLGGAAGDGAGENGGSAPPPTPAPEGGEPPPNFEGLGGMERGDKSTDPVAAWLALAGEMRTKSRDLTESWEPTKSRGLTPDSSSPVDALPPLSPTASAEAGVRRLARGALRVLRELYRRRPGQSARAANRLQWLTSLNRFAVIATRMGLWLLMRSEFKDNSNASRTWVFGRHTAPTDHELEYVIRMLLLDGTPGTRLWRWALNVIESATDPFEDLAMLPVPPDTVPFVMPDGQNLQSLLSAVVAIPNQILNRSSLGEERAELALFAAAYLNLGGECLPIWMEQSDIIDYFADQLVIRAHAWFAQNSPKIVYAEEIESLISHTSKIPA